MHKLNKEERNALKSYLYEEVVKFVPVSDRYAHSGYRNEIGLNVQNTSNPTFRAGGLYHYYYIKIDLDMGLICSGGGNWVSKEFALADPDGLFKAIARLIDIMETDIIIHKYSTPTWLESSKLKLKKYF